jgi:predicted anti-sigma-YlaC factor YlaD
MGPANFMASDVMRQFGGGGEPARRSHGVPCVGLVLLAGVLATGCSARKFAVNRVGDALAGGGTTFASDDDPELVKAAVPFSLKLMESLLAESPEHRGLLFATTSGFTQFGYAFVQQEADELEGEDLARATALRERAKKLYVRALNYGLRGLESRHRGFTNALAANPRAAVRVLRVADVPQLYWTAVAWGALISQSKDDPRRVGEVPQLEALVDRAVELDEGWNLGALHTFLITYEMARTGVPGDPAERSRRQFDLAMAQSHGWQAAPLVAYAEAVCVQKQDVRQFESLLQRALAVDVDAHPEFRLANLVYQRRARWLLGRKDELFLIPEPAEPKSR